MWVWFYLSKSLLLLSLVRTSLCTVARGVEVEAKSADKGTTDVEHDGESEYSNWNSECISAPFCQNIFSLFVVKNELKVFSESLGPPPSSTKTHGHSRLLKAKQKCFCKHLHITLSSVTIYKTPSHRKSTFPSLLVWIEYVKTPSCRKILIGFPFQSLKN